MNRLDSPMTPSRPTPRVRILGGETDAVTADAVMGFTEACVLQRRPAIIAKHNSHCLRRIRREPETAAFNAVADLIEVDSTPLIAWAHVLRRPLVRAHWAPNLDRPELF